jgi:hydrogenase maturation protein HypF
VYGLALRLGLSGFVLNDAEGVVIEAEGPPAALAALRAALAAEHPPLARVDAIEHAEMAPTGAPGFTIAHSQGAAQRSALIAPDTATCPDCLRELFDPADRRYRYPFINCTNCGPRFTIVADVPYDREKTTMRVFPMCPACRAEYENPLDRRFHAQPNACPLCGPAVRFEMTGQEIDEGRRTIDEPSHSSFVFGPSSLADPIDAAAALLAHGGILAVKGLGGYHLACDALSPAAVARLRARKHREAKPFALMVATLDAARELCLAGPAEAALLESHARPIVLLERRPGAVIPDALAPGHTALGVMLPYTPLHHLLLRAFAERAPGRPAALVLTSGNLSDEPIAFRDDDALERLAPIADAFLLHNRDILTRCDDTVTRVAAGGEQLFRRSRGYAPAPLELGRPLARPVLAYGAHLKNTFCLARGRQAFVSHHIGDLENLETLTSLREGIAHFQRLFDIAPEIVAHDLHPEYLATKEALASEVPIKIGVQHHHAHIASVIAEHALDGPVIGVAADGTGYGLDGAVWGCELLVADLAGFERAGHLAYVPLPGGDAAVRQPWRVAAAYLAQLYGPGFVDMDLPFTRALDRARWGVLAQMIARRVNSPPTSSLGRLFDAAAALIGLRGEAQYEGQAAIELEAIAERGAAPYPFAIAGDAPFQIEAGDMLAAMIEDLRAGVGASQIAGRFHASVAEFLAAACERARLATGIGVVALSGGVFQNRLLLERLDERLHAAGFQVFTNRRVPPNDGGISLGQAAVADERARRGIK